MPEKIALDIGCGERKVAFEGYKVMTVDVRPEINPDYVADAKSLPLDDESIDLIYSSHVLEHFGRNDVGEVIKHWRKKLKVGGILYTIVPDLSVAAIELLSGRTNPATWDILYGAQNYEQNFHKCGFTAPTLEAFLIHYGFEITKTETKDRQVFMEAKKNDKQYDW
jgi:predicted SAM-dependent methyltransferase